MSRAGAATVIVLGGLLVLPYVAALVRTPPGQQFTGVAEWLADQYCYLAWMRQVARGGPCYVLYTTEDHPPVAAPFFWAALGKIAGWLGASPPSPPHQATLANAPGRDLRFYYSLVLVYHAARVLIALAYLAVLWMALGLWVPERRRLLAFAVIGGGSGFGVAAVAAGIKRLASDVEMPELWSFSSMLFYPHFAASLLLLAVIWWALGELWLQRSRPALVPALLLTAASFGIGVIHPYTWVPLVGAIWGYSLVFGWRQGISPSRLLTAAAAPLAAVPYMLWQRQVMMSHPVLRQWMEQNVMPSPAPLFFYGIGLGLPFFAAIVSVVRTRQTAAADVRNSFPLTWVVVALLLGSGWPIVPFARRCVEGMHIALVLLPCRRWRRRLRG